MGRVYRGRDAQGRLVAVKVILEPFAGNAEFRQRFARELKAARALSDPHLAALIDGDASGDPPWMATEYISGPTLQERVDQAGPMSTDGVVGLTRDVASALRAMHAQGLVHRDVKPSNVILAEDGAHLIDLGVSKAIDGTQLTRAGVHPGTPAFMSPEQVRGQNVSASSDVFSLGCLLTFAATGLHAFGGGPSSLVLHRVAHEAPNLDAISNADLLNLISSCLQPNPADRPTSKDLTGWSLGQTHPRPHAADATTQFRRPDVGTNSEDLAPQHGHSRRRALVATVTAVVCLALGAVGVSHQSALSSVLTGEKGPSAEISSVPVSAGSSSLTPKGPGTTPVSASATPPSGSAPVASSEVPPLAPAEAPRAQPPAAAGPTPAPVATPQASAAPAPQPAATPTAAAPAATPTSRPSPAAPPPPANTTTCLTTAIDGYFSLPANKGSIAGGPNFTSARCNSIWIKLYSAKYVTFARACLEVTGGGSITRCGSWVRLSYPDTFDLLLTNVPAGSRWQLQMFGDQAEQVRFRYTS